MTRDQAEAAMCLWEALVEDRTNGPWRGYLEGNGNAATRLHVLDLAERCEEDWAEVADDYAMSFDWDFCPSWLEERVDWQTGEVRTDNREEWLAARKLD